MDLATIALLATIVGVPLALIALHLNRRSIQIAEREQDARIAKDRATEPKIEIPERPRWPQICSQDIVPDRHVVGRAEEIAQLRDELKDRKAAAIVPGIAIKGQGGMGKTTLAREYIREHRDRYFGIWWIAPQTRQALTESLCELAAALGITADPQAGTDALARAALVRVQQDREPWLLIFDNAEGPRSLRGWLPEAAHIHVLVTTREGTWPAEKFKLLQTGSLDFSTETGPAVTLLMQEAGRDGDAEGARELAEALGGLPLALVNAGAYLRDVPQVGFAAYAERLEEAIHQAPPEGGDYPDSVFGAVSLSLDRLSPEAAQIANILTFWAPEGLEPGLFEAVPARDEADEAFLPIPADLWPVLRAEGEVAKAFAELARRSLIERRGAGDAADYAMHRLTGAVIRARLGAEGRAQAREAAASVLAGAYPGDTKPAQREFWTLCAVLTPHVQALAGHGAAGAAADYLYNQASIYLGEMRQDLPALLLARASLKAKKRRLDPLHRDVGAGYTALGQQWTNLGRPVMAEKLLARAAAIAEENSETTDETLALRMSNHGGALADLGRRAQAAGRADEAATLFRRAARRYQRALLLDLRRGDRRAVATRLNNLGGLRNAQGRQAAAIRLGRMVLKIRRDVLAPDDPLLATSLHNLAASLLATADWCEAEPLLEDALTIAEDAFAAVPRHYNCVLFANFLAMAALMRGDRAKAEGIVARYAQDLDLAKLQRNALTCHLGIKAEAGQFSPEALAEILDLMGLSMEDAQRLIPEFFQTPDPA